jgi:hypothetical protein
VYIGSGSEEGRETALAHALQMRGHNFLVGGGAAIVAAAVAISLSLTAGGGVTGIKLTALTTPGPAGSEGVAVPNAVPLAEPAASTMGQPIDGIGCQAMGHSLFHIHAHLTIFVNGTARQVPAGIGIPGAETVQTPRGPFVSRGDCFYWLHTHVADGIIHIESPVWRVFTLGDFFDEWDQPLSTAQVGPAKGHVTVFYNGKVYAGDPRSVPLTRHAQIQLEVGTPLIAPVLIEFPHDL